MNIRAWPSAVTGDVPSTEEDNGKVSSGQRRAHSRVLFFLLLLLAGFGLYNLLEPETLPIRHVSVKGDFRHLSTKALQERARDAVTGGFFNVNVETIQKILLEEPWIKDVSVQRIWPDRIMVTVREQTAVARWVNDALLNDDGELFFPDTEAFPDKLPVFKGPQGSHTQILAFYRRLQTALPEKFRLVEVTLSKRRSWHVGFADGPHVYLGRANLEKRVNRFAEYVPTRLGEFFDNIRSLDMRYTNGFAVRWEPDFKPEL